MKECPACHRCFSDHLNHCPNDGDLLKFTIHGDTVLDGRYQLEKKLGQGGMGMVFKARHVFLKTAHAVKVILPDLVGNDPSLTTRFRQEAMAAAAIRHPNTINVTDFGIINGTTPFLVMEFVEGGSLHELLGAEKRLTPARAVEVMLAVCAGVAAAHKLGIVHRDLKPLNILVRQDLPPREGVKVLDFGLAKIKSGELLGSFVAAQTQGMMGSPFYMAPEQWSDEDIDVRADIYSLGIIFYQMLAGEVPFRGGSLPSIMNKHLTTAPAPLSERGVSVPEEVERAVCHALEKNPANRPQTVEDFMAELRAALTLLNSAEMSVAAETMPLAPGETLGLPPPGPATDSEQAGGEGLKTVAGTGPFGGAAEPARSASAPPPAAADTEAPAAAGHPGHATDTAHQHVGRTAPGPPDAPDRARPVPPADGETMTMPPSVRHENVGGADDGRRAERDARARAEEESRLREAEEARRRREDEEQRRRGAEERARQEAAAREWREAEERRRLSAQALAAGQQPAAAGVVAAYGSAAQAGAGVAAPVGVGAPSRAPLIIAGGVFFLVLLGGGSALAYYFLTDDSPAANVNTGRHANTGATASTNTSANANADPRPTAEASRAELITLAGGTFRMGSDDVPALTDEARRTRPGYLLWKYNQWPAHEVSVRPFAIDRTEVTNAEYAAFVRQTRHPAPPGAAGDGGRPPAGEEMMPVVNVSYEDANAFAAWRSERDGTRYRLPTEEEWEFAARGGKNDRSYPWGGPWSSGYANLGGAGPAPVGSFPLGEAPQGIQDLIGNVWEWTDSPAQMYAGNNRTALSREDQGKVVVRGGSFANQPDGDEPITLTARRWVAKDFRSGQLGFRLVRAEP